MAKRRTKAQKRTVKKIKKVSKVNQKTKNLLAYDPGLIRADLTKTLILAILAVGIIVSLYFLKLL